ncbi:MAG: hypothetical protein RR263_04360 [Oscillospiraceae bacterium]
MKFLRLIAGIAALAGIGVIAKQIVCLIMERHDSKYIHSRDWDESDY